MRISVWNPEYQIWIALTSLAYQAHFTYIEPPVFKLYYEKRSERKDCMHIIYIISIQNVVKKTNRETTHMSLRIDPVAAAL